MGQLGQVGSVRVDDPDLVGGLTLSLEGNLSAVRGVVGVAVDEPGRREGDLPLVLPVPSDGEDGAPGAFLVEEAAEGDPPIVAVRERRRGRWCGSGNGEQGGSDGEESRGDAPRM